LNKPSNPAQDADLNESDKLGGWSSNYALREETAKG